MSIVGVTDAPVSTSGDISSGFQSQSGQPYSHLAKAYIPQDVPLM